MRPRFRRLRRFIAFFCIGTAGLIVLDGDTAPPAFSPSPAPIQLVGGESEAASASTTAPVAPGTPAVRVAVRALSSHAAVRAAEWREKNRLLEALIGALTMPLAAATPAAVIELVPLGAGVALPDAGAPPLGKKLADVRYKLFPAPPKLTSPRLGFSSLAAAAGRD